MREKMIELIGMVQDEGKDYSDCFIEGDKPISIENCRLADYLIANGATIPVRCKDCDYYEKEHLGFGFCKYFDIGRADNDFCSSCIRRDGE